MRSLAISVAALYRSGNMPGIEHPSTLLIFDLDGTLYDTESSFLPTMQAIFDRYGVSYVGDRQVMSMVGETYSTFLTWLRAQGFDADEDTLAEAISSLEVDSIEEDGRLYPGVAETLQTLKAQGHLLAICTNGDQPYTRKILGKFGLIELFDAIKTHGDAGETKTEMIRQLLERFEPSHTFMIGDRYHDFISGAANGCTVVAARYGFANAGEADEVDAAFSEFPTLLEIVQSVLAT